LLRNAHVSQTSFLNEERFIGAPIETDLQVLEHQVLERQVPPLRFAPVEMTKKGLHENCALVIHLQNK
jgi:hypothetical protein